MIRRLQIKFVAMCMALVTAVLATVVASTIFSSRQNMEQISREVLQRVIGESAYSITVTPGHVLVPGEGVVPIAPMIGFDLDGTEVQLPYFTIRLQKTFGTYTARITGGTYANLEDTQALTTIVEECLEQNQREGTIHSYQLRYLRRDAGLYEEIAFVDMSMEVASLREMVASYLQIGLAALLLLLGVSILLSRWAVRPVERALRQQRQFLSDASHELKTPLTVILSNAEMLETASLEDRSARWADNICSEARRMKSLVEEMLTLARADNMARTAAFTEVCLSDLATDCVLAFEPVAFEAGKSLTYTIAPDLSVLGDRDKLHQIISVLLDNAVKYSAPGGTITLTLYKTDRQVRLITSNPGDPIPPDQLPRLFERFYRADASRGEQSGFGLGLPIAAALAAEHRGTLRAESDQTSTRFILTLPLKK